MSIKTEPEIEPRPSHWNVGNAHLQPMQRIKPDDDEFEDAGDLDFSSAQRSASLIRIPKFLYDSWTSGGKDEAAEIKLGRVRVEGSSDQIVRMSMMLDTSVSRNRKLPKEYNMVFTNRKTNNTFIFSEKDQRDIRNITAEQAPKHWLNRKRIEKREAVNLEKRMASKHTGIYGSIQNEICCLPVENDEYRRLMDQQTLLNVKPKKTTKLLESIIPGAGNIVHPGIASSGAALANFVGTSSHNRRKDHSTRGTRLLESELMDAIFRAFESYTYWPFRVLNERLQQPEAYLRETLSKIAFQAKSGTHMMEWQLKPGYRISTYAGARDFSQAKDEAAPSDDQYMADSADVT